MKWMIILVSMILIAPYVAAINTTMASTYQPAETMIIQITGNILEPITPSDIVFKRSHVAVAVDYDVKRIGENYYLYAQLPLAPNNYTLFINNVATTVNGVVTTIYYNQTFTVNGSLVEYNVNPGFAITQENLVLTITSNVDEDITINLNFPVEQAITIKPGTNTIQLSTESVAPGVYQATIGQYILPIQVLATSLANTDYSVYMSPREINRVVLQDQSITYPFYLINNGSTEASDLTFIFDNSLITVTPSFISSISPNSSQVFNISLARYSGLPLQTSVKVYGGGDVLDELHINISFTSDPDQTTPIDSGDQLYYCSELNGRFCAATQVCATDLVQALDGSCCMSSCSDPEESGGLGWIGYVSIAVALLLIVFIYLRYKKTAMPKPKNLTAPPIRSPILSTAPKEQPK